MDRLVLGELFAEVLELCFLREAFHRDAAPLPGGLTLLEGDVVEGATAPQDHVQRLLLLRRCPQFLLVGRAHTLHHTYCRFPSRISTRFDVASRRTARRIASLSLATPYRSLMREMAALSASSSQIVVRFFIGKVYHNAIHIARAKASEKPASA